MSEAFWEQAVALWITRHRFVFVSPSYNLGKKGEWASLDFLAVDFAECAIWAVEVTTSSGAEKILTKAAAFDEAYVPKIQEALRDSGGSQPILPVDKAWPVGLWAFVRASSVERVRVKIGSQVSRSKVTSIEEIAFPWGDSWWSDRFH